MSAWKASHPSIPRQVAEGSGSGWLVPTYVGSSPEPTLDEKRPPGFTVTASSLWLNGGLQPLHNEYGAGAQVQGAPSGGTG